MGIEEGRELLILGILRRAPLSAYALNRAVRAHAPLYRPLKEGNVYNAVKGLHLRGLLLAREERSLRGPAKTKSVYRISAGGERRFHTLLRAVVDDLQAPDPTLEIAYVLLGQLARNEARRLLAHRLQLVTDQEGRLARLFGGTRDRAGSGFFAMKHSYARLEAESSFLRASLKLLDNKKWYPQWISDDGPIADATRRL